MGQEFELKFAATIPQQEKIRSVYGPWEKIDMETTYYDTPNRALSAHRITLRCRKENGVSICTVKTPLGDYARGEWECRCGSIEQALPQLVRLGAPKTVAALAENGLTAVCGARFTRYACSLDLDGATAELALDQGVLLGNGKEIPLCEVEVERKSGADAVITDFAAALAAEYNLTVEHRSKFRRAMLLAEGE